MRLCLWAVLALVSAHRAVDTPQVDASKIDQQIRHELIDLDTDFDICHVQALSVLIILQMALDQLEAAWLMSAQASRMILAYLTRNVNFDDRTARTLRGCIYLDFLLSAYLDRSACWSHKDMGHLEQKLDLDSSDEWQPGETWSSHGTSVKSGPLRALSNLEYIMNIICSTSGDMNRPSNLYTSQSSHVPLCPQVAINSTIVPSIEIGPAALNAHLMRFFLLRRHEKSDPRQLQELTKSTTTLVKKYMDQAESAMAMPIVLLYLKDVVESIQLRTDADATLDVDERQQALNCSDLWVRSKGMWLQRPSNMPAQNNEVTSTQIEGHQAQQGALQSSGLGQLPPDTSLDNLANTNRLSDNARYTLIPDEIPHSTFDATYSTGTLDELSPLIPVDRSGQTPVFAHNLGFINEDWEHDWYASAQFTGNVTDPG